MSKNQKLIENLKACVRIYKVQRKGEKTIKKIQSRTYWKQLVYSNLMVRWLALVTDNKIKK